MAEDQNLRYKKMAEKAAFLAVPATRDGDRVNLDVTTGAVTVIDAVSGQVRLLGYVEVL